MYNAISNQIVSFVYVIILSLIYFLKRKYNFLESKIYKNLLLFTTITTVLDIFSVYIFTNFEEISWIVTKIYFISQLIWIIIFMTYILLNTTHTKYSDMKSYLKKSILGKSWFYVSIILTVLMLFLKVGHTGKSYIGSGVTLIYALGMIGSLFLLIILMSNNRKIDNYKNWSMLISIVLLCITLTIQMNYSEILVMSSGMSLVVLFLYFTIENPDLKYIDELNVLKEEAEIANKSKTDFLASMSHEIRTPMNAIIGLSNSLLNSNIPKEMYDDISNINKASETLLEIINNILDITKIEEGKTTVNNKLYDLGDTIAELKNITEAAIGEKPIKFTIETIGSLPTKFNGDEVKVYQILMNLLSNAVKYTKEGNIKLTIESRIFGNRAALRFKVIDTGIGIKKSDSDKIFQKFERLDQEKKNIQGTGLGLAITKNLLDMLGGKISFTSVYQKGTTFVVDIEQEIADKQKINDLSTYQAKKKTVDEYFDGKDYEILLVDDNLLNLKVAEKLLKKYNFNITTASSGLECINKTKTKKYDLILLDHMMPEMDGIHTLYNLKKRVSGFDTPVVVLTANAIEGSKEMYLGEGFCDYLSKPINQVELDKVLRKQLNIKGF